MSCITISHAALIAKVAQGKASLLSMARHRVRCAIDRKHTLFVGCTRYKHVRGGLWRVSYCIQATNCKRFDNITES